MRTGYATRAYAESLCLGELVHLPTCDGYLAAQIVPPDSVATDATDLTGPYPFLVCQSWDGLKADLDALPSDYVSVSLVTDPFAQFDPQALSEFGWDKFTRFKQHYVVSLGDHLGSQLSRHHRRNVRRAAKNLELRSAEEPALLLDIWCQLYDQLIDRHSVKGVSAFSRASFERQLSLIDLRAIVAYTQDEVVGATLWIVDGDVVYYHLGAYSALGYKLRASYALFYEAIATFRGEYQYLALGGGAGSNNDVDGLTRFKEGWATETREVYFCGRVLNPKLYEDLCRLNAQASHTAWFPAYRAP